jgi:fructose-1,6-bisphosphatase II
MKAQLRWRNIGLDLIRVTETTALAASPWIGSGNYAGAHRAANRAMSDALNSVEMQGRIVIGEERRVDEEAPLCGGHLLGTGEGPEADLAVDPIDGTNLLIKGRPGAISVASIAPRGALWSPLPALYMDKIVVDREAADALAPECLDAPAAWTLALIARVKGKAVRDLAVIVLARARHVHLIEEIRETGARILLREEGDAEGALVAATVGTVADVLMGIGGASQGVLAACAVKALGGGMLARLAPQSEAERTAVLEAGLDTQRIYKLDEIVSGDQIFFAATGITDSPLLPAIKVHGRYTETHSLLIRAETGTRRHIHAEHMLRRGKLL